MLWYAESSMLFQIEYYLLVVNILKRVAEKINFSLQYTRMPTKHHHTKETSTNFLIKILVE